MYKYNKDVEYPARPYYSPKSIAFNVLEVAVGEQSSFQIKVVSPFDKYLNPPIKNDNIPKMWVSHPIQFYQNQLNFAIYCATAGCGISYADHLNHPNRLVRSVYRFHLYYQFRRILSELQAPMPHERSFNPFNNRINMKIYERLCNEFGIDFKTDFRQKLDLNHGMGTLYYWGTHRVYNYDYWPGHTSFSPGTTVRLGSIEQEHENAWTTFILDTGKGFTRPGVERINESIRTYVWCLLGSQAQTRSDIMDATTGFDTQKQYLANLEDVVNSAVDLPSSIKRYQDVLRFARSKVDFTVGNGLYMLPSDLRLQVGLITNYNNLIVIAEDGQQLGKNEQLNSRPAGGVLQTIDHSVPVPQPTDTTSRINYDSRESEKTALVIGLVGLGLFAIYFR